MDELQLIINAAVVIDSDTSAVDRQRRLAASDPLLHRVEGEVRLPRRTRTGPRYEPALGTLDRSRRHQWVASPRTAPGRRGTASATGEHDAPEKGRRKAAIDYRSPGAVSHCRAGCVPAGTATTRDDDDED